MKAEADSLFNYFSSFLNHPKHLTYFELGILESKKKRLRVLAKNLPVQYLQTKYEEFKTLLHLQKRLPNLLSAARQSTKSYLQSITDILEHQIKMRTSSETVSGNPTSSTPFLSGPQFAPPLGPSFGTSKHHELQLTLESEILPKLTNR